MELLRPLNWQDRNTQCNGTIPREGKVFKCVQYANYLVHGRSQHLRLCKFHASLLAKELAKELFNAELEHWYEKEN